MENKGDSQLQMSSINLSIHLFFFFKHTVSSYILCLVTISYHVTPLASKVPNKSVLAPVWRPGITKGCEGHPFVLQ